MIYRIYDIFETYILDQQENYYCGDEQADKIFEEFIAKKFPDIHYPKLFPVIIFLSIFIGVFQVRSLNPSSLKSSIIRVISSNRR